MFRSVVQVKSTALMVGRHSFLRHRCRPLASSLANSRIHTLSEEPEWCKQLRERRDLLHVDAKETLLREYPKASTEIHNHFIYGTLARELSLETYYGEDDRSLWAIAGAGVGLRNVQGTLHGGAITTIFDGVFGVLFAASGFSGFTANLATNYRRPVLLPTCVLVQANVCRVEGRKVFMVGTLSCGSAMDPIVYADASSLYVTKDV
eukprot:TRINITY_DN54368_c0_g1_i1.p1 TRINITY_DN54368_c0_g1~~TRINITY_DN54368_c0_g1_i1.p1  ORF type:complete len:206 (-),score=18.51 TRINITY_DN54368_c0_g1_i1:91-708(-)